MRLQESRTQQLAARLVSYRDLDQWTHNLPFGAWKTPMTEQQSDDGSLPTRSEPGMTAKPFDHGTTQIRSLTPKVQTQPWLPNSKLSVVSKPW